MTVSEITQNLKDRARRLGFSLCGVCPAVPSQGVHRLDEWLAAGYAGQMHYISDRRQAYAHPYHLLEGARSIVMLGMPYVTSDPDPRLRESPGSPYGRVARYAWGSADYHDVIRDRLHELADDLRKWIPDAQTRGVVDTAPLLEREFAQLAGLGWIGKNTLLLNKQAGSYFFLAALLTDAELETDTPHIADHCGTCTACLDACPTQAFPQPYVLDATRCISYLTIELHDTIPAHLRQGMGDWVFGCDVCQEVCPWNREPPKSSEPVFMPVAEMNPLDLTELFNLDEEGFRKRFRHTPLWRAHRRGLLRSAAIVLGNRKSMAAVPALAKGLNDVEPVVRAACAWAMGQINTEETRGHLLTRRKIETDQAVIDEINAAVDHVSPSMENRHRLS